MRAEARCEEYGVGAFGFDVTGIQASKQQESQGKNENHNLQTGQSSKGFLRVHGDQWTTAHVAVSPTLVGVSKCSTTSAQSGVTIPCGVRPPRCNRSRSASSTKSQMIWERLAATAVYALLMGQEGSRWVRIQQVQWGKQQGAAGVQQVMGLGSVQRLWVADLLSRTGLSWVQLSRGTQCGEQGDRAGRAVSRQGTKIGWRLPQLDLCYLYIDYGTRVQYKRDTEYIIYDTTNE